MDFMKSSLIDVEFINFRKQNNKTQRQKYFRNMTSVHNSVPVVIDSINKDISALMSGCDIKRTSRREWTYGLSLNANPSDTVKKLFEMNLKNLLNENYSKVNKFCNEDGEFINPNMLIGECYNRFKNVDDNILYLIITQETTVYGYILSLFRTLFNWGTKNN